MPLIKDNQLLADPWVTVDDEAALPDGAPAIVSLERWQSEHDTLLVRNAPLGIRLRSDQLAKTIAEDLDRFQVIALEFPKFADGRAYSSARLLRERYGYEGELRAVGNVLRDQALFMLRCGFDAFEVAEGNSLEGWRTATGEISVFYQPTGDGQAAIPRERHRRRGPIESPDPAVPDLEEGGSGDRTARPHRLADHDEADPRLAAAGPEAIAGQGAY